MTNTFTPDWSKLQRMQDDRIVRGFMSEVDTKIDSIVLDWRSTDVLVDQMCGLTSMWDHIANRAIDAWLEHRKRPVDLQQMIEEIRASGHEIPAERHADIGFGPYDGNNDKYLAMVLDYAGAEFADEETGSTEWSVYVMRFGRVILTTDDRGFRDATVYDTEDEAKKLFGEADKEYGNWAAQEECD